MSPRDAAARAHRACEPLYGHAERGAAVAYAAAEFWNVHLVVAIVSAVLLASGAILVVVRFLEARL